MTDFEGLAAVVTGGASGIGAATARLLQSRGAQVAALDPNTDGVPDGVLTQRCDVTDNDAEWARVLDVNVTGIARVTRAALPHLRRSPNAVVVNTCSAAAFVGVRQRALYAASKGAVLALTLAMAADHVTEGIRVNAVAPGTADT